MDAAMIIVMQIHLSEPEGDILLFLTGAARCVARVNKLQLDFFEVGVLGRLHGCCHDHGYADPPQ
jgi:HrpA-like RNA helicase